MFFLKISFMLNAGFAKDEQLFNKNSNSIMIQHYSQELPPQPRGFHLITDQIEAHLRQVHGELPESGLLHVFIQHSSAGLTINENADPTVREDFESVFNRRLMPEDEPYLKHTLEGPDDMPAHIKSTLTGSSVSIPIAKGQLLLGTWQGIYLCEFRNQARPRHLILSLYS